MFLEIDLVDFLITILVLVFAIAVHEFAHAWTAMQLGDRTAYYQGRVTLHPAAHLDPMGTMMMFISSFTGYGIGWGKPVPVNPRYLRYGPRVGMAITAAAGPASNILQAIVAGIALRLLFPNELRFYDLFGVWPQLSLVALFLLTAFWINIGLALFNLIPLFPLDGFSIVRGVLATIRARWAYDLSDFFDQLQPYAPMLLLMLIALEQLTTGRAVLGTILWVPAEKLAHLILGV